MKRCERIQLELKESKSRLKDLEKDIQRHEEPRRAEICKTYERELDTLNTWKSNSLMELEKTYSDWYSRCRVAAKDLETTCEEIERIMSASRDTLSSTDVTFIKGVKQLQISIDKQVSGISNALRKQEDVTQNLRSATDLQLVLSPDVLVKEKSSKFVMQPVFKFTKTSDKVMKINDHGSLLEANNLLDNVYYTGWTDGVIQSGLITWGMELTVLSSSSDYACCCRPGIAQMEGGDMWRNLGITSWFIRMEHYDQQVRFYNSRFEVTSGYGKLAPHTRSYRLGFSLNCDKQTLTVTDCDHYLVMMIIPDIDLAQPVVPAVGVSVYGQCSVSVRIFHWDGSDSD